MNFAGKTAVVTGGSRGIGRAICEELARGGANVVLCYAGRAEAAQETVTACEDLGAKALAVQCNVADEAQVKALMDAAVKEFGRIDILVNNAGVTRDGLVMMMKEADFDAVIDTNLKGTFLCMKAVSRIMMKQRYGRIVNLSSVVGLRGNAGQVNYAASKAGVVGMTKSLAKELASRGVTVNAVAPGFIETDMTAAMPQAAKDAMMPTIPMQRLGARRMWQRPWPSWPATRPPMSPARSWPSTGAWRCETSKGDSVPLGRSAGMPPAPLNPHHQSAPQGHFRAAFSGLGQSIFGRYRR